MFAVMGAACLTGSLFFKKIEYYYMLHIAGHAFEALHFFMLGINGVAGTYSSALMNVICLVMNVFLLTGKPWAKSAWTMAGFLAASAGLGVYAVLAPDFTMYALVPPVVLFVSTIVMWLKNNLILHIYQITVSSPLFIWYNLSTGSIPNFFVEILNIIMTLIYFVRVFLDHRKKKAKGRSGIKSNGN